MDRAWDERPRQTPVDDDLDEAPREDAPAVWVVDLRSHRVVRRSPRLPALAGRER